MADAVDVVVVDDDPVFRDIMAEILGQRWTVAAFSSAAEALVQLRRQMPRLLVADLRMPGLNGFMLIAEAKALSPELLTLVVSGEVDEANPAACGILARFADAWLGKPFTVGRLQETVAGLLGGHASRVSARRRAG